MPKEFDWGHVHWPSRIVSKDSEGLAWQTIGLSYTNGDGSGWRFFVERDGPTSDWRLRGSMFIPAETDKPSDA